MAEYRLGQAFWLQVGRPIEVEDYHFVRPSFQPWPWNIETVLRADFPEPAQRVPIDPDCSLAQTAHVEVGIAGLGEREVAAQETRTVGSVFGVFECDTANIVHRESVYIPGGQFPSRQSDRSGDTFSFLAETLGEIYASSILHQDVERVL
jgi:hypothetical protein